MTAGAPRFAIEVLRGGRWSGRGDGELSATITREALVRELGHYAATQHPHRLTIDGRVAAVAWPLADFTSVVVRVG